jgi:hypothetical protein
LRFLLGLTLSLLIGGCASSTKNFVSKDELFFKGGVYKTKEWRKEGLTFKRYSWYQDMSLLYDVLVSPIEKTSPFYSWLNESEKKWAGSCEEFYITLSYALDSKKISHIMFQNAYKQAGFEKVLLSNYSDHMRLHPKFVDHSLHLYSIYGLCRKAGAGEPFKVAFPSFKEITL